MMVQHLGWCTLRSVLFSPRELVAFHSLIPMIVASKVTEMHSGAWFAMIDEFTYQICFDLGFSSLLLSRLGRFLSRTTFLHLLLPL